MFIPSKYLHSFEPFFNYAYYVSSNVNTLQKKINFRNVFLLFKLNKKILNLLSLKLPYLVVKKGKKKKKNHKYHSVFPEVKVMKCSDVKVIT